MSTILAGTQVCPMHFYMQKSRGAASVIIIISDYRKILQMKPLPDRSHRGLTPRKITLPPRSQIVDVYILGLALKLLYEPPLEVIFGLAYRMFCRLRAWFDQLCVSHTYTSDLVPPPFYLSPKIPPPLSR